jgi:hypothetical protein
MMSTVKSIGFVYTSHKVMTFPAAAAGLLPPGLEDMAAGLTLCLTLNMVAGSDDTSTSMTSISDSQTADAEGGGDLKAKMQDDFNKKRMENFVIQLPFSITEFCVSHSFLMWNTMTQTVGIDIFPPDHRYLAFKPSLCFSWAPLAVIVNIKVTEERDMYEGGFIARMYGLSTKKTVLRETEFQVAITMVGIDISAVSSAALTRTEDTWLVNPWGLLPKVAVLFPQTMGAGVMFTYAAGIPVPTFLEFETGFAGCSYGFATLADKFNEVFNEWFEDAIDDTLGGGGGAAAALGRGAPRGADGAKLPGLNAAILSKLHELRAHPGGGGADGTGFDLDYRVGKVLGRTPTKGELAAVARRMRHEKAALGGVVAAEAEQEEAARLLRDPAAAAAAAAALGQEEFAGPWCSDDDPYGTTPLTVKIALSVSFVNPSEIAFTLESRAFSLGRMLYILIPPLDMFAFLMDIAEIFAPFLDATLSWDLLYVAFNPMPFPVVLYSGTTIPAGFTLRIENFNFMNFLKARLVCFKFDPSIGEVALQVYIDPFTLNLGGVDILEVRGVTSEDKTSARVLTAQKDAEKSRREAESKMAMMDALVSFGLAAGVNCTEVLCSSCARAFEGQAISVNCSMSPGFVISDILDGAWGEDANQPEWFFSTVPGACGASEIDTGDAMVTANRSATIRTLVKKCRGRETCEFDATTRAMGNVWDTENPLALSVIAVCADASSAAAGWAAEVTDMFGDGCADGCYTCATGHPHALNVVCGEGQIIADIVQAAYTPVDEVEPWEFDEAPSMCAEREVEDGGHQCVPDLAATQLVFRLLCLGRATQVRPC